MRRLELYARSRETVPQPCSHGNATNDRSRTPDFFANPLHTCTCFVNKSSFSKPRLWIGCSSPRISLYPLTKLLVSIQHNTTECYCRPIVMVLYHNPTRIFDSCSALQPPRSTNRTPSYRADIDCRHRLSIKEFSTASAEAETSSASSKDLKSFLEH